MQSAEQQKPSGRRGTKSFFVASMVAQLCALARYMVLARILGPEQLGLAVTLILTAQFFESITDSGSDRFLIQDPQGDTEAVQKLVQLVALGRGLLIASALVLFAGPIASFYKAPDLATGFMILAISPLIQGFLHLDLRRLQRAHDFHREGVALICAETASLAATIWAALSLGNYTAILYGLIARSVVLVAVSHLMAERRYRVGFSGAVWPRLSRFALPLLPNGLLIFLGSQGDRLLIANKVGLAELGHYSATLLLIFYPTGILQKFVGSVYLPLIAQRHQDGQTSSNAFGGIVLLMSLAMSFGFVLIAPVAVRLLYGEAFAQTVFLIALVAVLQTSRFIRMWPTTIALAKGKSSVVLGNNIARLLAFPAAFAGYQLTQSISGLLAGFIIGEMIALCIAQGSLNLLTQMPLLHDARRIVLFVGLSSALLATAYAITHDLRATEIYGMSAIALLGGLTVYCEKATLLQLLRAAKLRMAR